MVGNVACWSCSSGTSAHFEEWRSTDHGYTWTFVGTIQQSDNLPNNLGIWEPFLALDASGHLVCYFSDERQHSTYSQFLGHITSTDGGATWSSETMDVASTNSNDRPGMATVAKTSSGLYVMAFEDCNGDNCDAHIKTSSDGQSWGSGPSDMGVRASTAGGGFLRSSPYVVWSPVGGPNGELILSAQTYYSNGTTQGITGTLLVNTNNGSGNWNVLPGPYLLSSSGTCNNNYSSALLASATGSQVMEASVGAGCDERVGAMNAGSLPYFAPFYGGTDAGWSNYNGTWSLSNGVYSETAGGASGNKAVAGSDGWTDYTMQGDVELTSSNVNAGLLVRVTNPQNGADALSGYFAGIDASGTLFLGRENFGWTNLYSTPMQVSINTWYHMTVQAVGCTFTVSALNVGSTGTPTTFSYTDSGCSATAGQIGVRDYNGTAAFRNISVTSGGTTNTSISPYLAPFASGSVVGWANYGGNWVVSPSNETYADTISGPGDKSVYGSTSWGNYTLQSDVQINSGTQAGLIVRVSNPSVGADSLNGYYAGLNTNGTLVLGKENGSWQQLALGNLPGGTATNTWYHMTVQAIGNQLTATVTGLGNSVGASDDVTVSTSDSSFGTGAIGIRDHYSPATWRNVTMTPN